jgi:tetratricopeptide (TPR) repeat protein
VRPLLPGAPGCLVVVTSRDQLAGLIVADDARAVTLDVLTEPEAVDLLVRRIGRSRVEAEPAEAADIVAACARLPLALSVVAARAAMHPGFSLATLAAELRQSRGGLDSFAGGDTVSDVRTVLSWSYRTLSPAGARLFRLLGLHPGPNVTAPAAASLAGVPPAQVRPLLAELARAHLVVEQVPGRFGSHDLLRAYAAELVREHDPEPERDAAVHRMLDHYLRTACAADALLDPHRDVVELPPSPAGVTPEEIADRARAVDWFTAEHEVLLAAVAQAAAARLDEHTALLAWALVSFLDRRGYWGDLAGTQHLALGAVERLGDQAAAAHAHRSLARAYARTGRYPEALEHLRAALTVSEQVDDRTGQARTHLNLAWVLELQGDYAVALKHAGQALALNEAMGHRPALANALNAVGWLRARVGDNEAAVVACRQALALAEELGDEQQQAATWDSIGFAYHRMGRFAEAVSAYQRAADLLQELGDRFSQATALRHLGDVHVEAGDPAAAETVWRRALSLLEKLNHPDAEQIRARLTAAAAPT